MLWKKKSHHDKKTPTNDVICIYSSDYCGKKVNQKSNSPSILESLSDNSPVGTLNENTENDNGVF